MLSLEASRTGQERVEVIRNKMEIQELVVEAALEFLSVTAQ